MHPRSNTGHTKTRSQVSQAQHSYHWFHYLLKRFCRIGFMLCLCSSNDTRLHCGQANKRSSPIIMQRHYLWPMSGRSLLICQDCSTPQQVKAEASLECLLLHQITLPQKGPCKIIFEYTNPPIHRFLLKAHAKEITKAGILPPKLFLASCSWNNTVNEKILFHFCKGERSHIMNPLGTTQVNCFKNVFVCISNAFHCNESFAFLKGKLYVLTL